MRACLLPLAIACALLAPRAACQESEGRATRERPAGKQDPERPTTEADKARRKAAKKKAIARMRADLAKAAAHLQANKHAYKGSLEVASYNENNAMVPLERDFRGANDGTIDWFHMDGWTVAARGRKVAVQDRQAAWTEPQGNSPDVPISPLLFVPHLLKAELSLPEPAEHEGRPALRIYARWLGKPIKKLLFDMTVPSSQHEQVLEALASAAARGRKNLQCDATFLYDPASRQWLAATLRFAYLDGRPIPENQLPPKAPKGLPHLESNPMIEATWHIERQPFADVEVPDYDHRARQLLRLGKDGLPLPAADQAKPARTGK